MGDCDSSDDEILFGSFGAEADGGDAAEARDEPVTVQPGPSTAKQVGSGAGDGAAAAESEDYLPLPTVLLNGDAAHAAQPPPPPSGEAGSQATTPPPKKFSSWASVLRSNSGASEAPPAEAAKPKEEQPMSNGHGSASGSGADQGAGKGDDGVADATRVLQLLSGLGRETTRAAVTQALMERRARGLLNTGNACFRNVILQALLACEPFFRILTELKELLEDPVVRARYEAAVPTWVQLMRLASTFEDPGLARVVAYRKEDDEEVVMGKKARARKASNAGASSNSSSRREEWIGSVRPDDFLGAAFTDFRRSSPGQQEDAHEFLVFFLDRLHDEIVTLQRSGGGGGGDSAPAKGAEASNGGAEEVEGEWQEIGKGGTKAVLNSTGVAEVEDRFDSSAITSIFHGRLRSDLKRSGSRTVSATLQRFDCLQLDIKGRDVNSVEDALGLYLSEETLSEGGFKGAKRMTLELLPQVLILQLKRFTFDPVRGPLKVIKPVEYATTLTIPASLLSSSLKLRSTTGARYNLFCVVLHFGRTIGGGHYTSYCRGHFPGEWYYFDDERVERVAESHAISHREQVYLCFYEREP